MNTQLDNNALAQLFTQARTFNAFLEKEVPDGRYKSNFLINIGYGDASKNYPRGPRLEFTDAVAII